MKRKSVGKAIDRDSDFRALKQCVKYMKICTPRMRRATLEFLWWRFIEEPREKGEPR